MNGPGDPSRRGLIAVTGVGITSLALPAALAHASPDGSSAGATVVAAGGDTVTDVTVGTATYRVHTFTTVGATDLVVTTGGSVEVLLVAGGGGGGNHTNRTDGYRAGGGGGGGMIETTLTLSAGTYTIVVGAGGVGAASGPTQGGDGGDSTGFGLTAVGGGGGAGSSTGAGPTGRNGRLGGSGGGGAHDSGIGFGGDGTLEQGAHQFSLPAGSLGQGMYIYRLTHEGGVKEGKFAIQ